MNCNSHLNNKLINDVVKSHVANETQDLLYLQKSMTEFIRTLKEIVLGEFSLDFFNEYINDALKVEGSNLQELLEVPKMGIELKQALVNINSVIEDSKQNFEDNLVLLLDKYQNALDNISYTARDPYDTAVELGFEGTKQDWIQYLRGDSAYDLAVEYGFRGTEVEWLDSLVQEQKDEVARIDSSIADIDSSISAVKEDLYNSGVASQYPIGIGNGKIPIYQDLVTAFFTRLSSESMGITKTDLNERIAPGVYYHHATSPNAPGTDFITYHFRLEVSRVGDRMVQVAIGHVDSARATRSFHSADQTWTAWKPLAQTANHYVNTTSIAANLAVIDEEGTLARVTSSEKYKNILNKLDLDDSMYEAAISVKPIVYRSKSESDPKNWHFMSFSAEELGELDPALTFWKTHVKNPETGEQVELEEKEAEGINLNAICAVLHATNIYQDKKIKELEQRLTALESSNEPIE